MAWNPNDNISLDSLDLDGAPEPENFDRKPPPIIQRVEEQLAAGGAGSRRPRPKGARMVEINPNEPLKMPSGRSVTFVQRRLPLDRCKVFSGNQRDFSALTEEDVSDILPSIKAGGVLVPVVARPCGDDSWEIIDGSRRYFSAGIAGCVDVPAMVGDITDEDALYLTAIYNNYEKPSPYELGLFVRRLRETATTKLDTVSAVCSYLGITERTYYRVLQIVDLPSYVIDRIPDPRALPLATSADLGVAIAKLTEQGRGGWFESEVAAIKQPDADPSKWIARLLKLASQPQAPSTAVPTKHRAESLANKAGVPVLKVMESTKGTLKVELLTDMALSLEILAMIKKKLGCP